MKKICIKCNKLKELCDFYLHIETKDGYRKACKTCSPSIGVTKHGHSPKSGESRTYISWTKMKYRCNSKKGECFKYYKNISYCKRWEKFENFLKDMGERPNKKSLDRINNNKGYSKNNCRWATNREQNLNKRTNFNSYSIYKGVHKNNRGERNKWRTSIYIDGHNYHIGVFKTEKEAFNAYKIMFKEWYGFEYAYKA